MEVIRESNTCKIKLISFGKCGHQRTAQIALIDTIKTRRGERRISTTLHVHYKNGTWLYVEIYTENGKQVQRGYEVMADCLPKQRPALAQVA